jgi:hypothetical protein
VAEGRIQWQQHALERLLERGITRAEVVAAMIYGEVIETYAVDRPYPSCLILHVQEQPVHVVAAVDAAARVGYIITAYRPDPEHFEADLRTRRGRS